VARQTGARQSRTSDLPQVFNLCIPYALLVSCRATASADISEVLVMKVTEARFHDLVDALQEALEDIFDDSGLDLDVENSSGVLTVKFAGNGGTLIFSRQEPLRQLWLAARSGGFHFDYDEEEQNWKCDKSEELLGEMLKRIVKSQAEANLDFTAVDDESER
jgi:CyaY protein